MSTEYKVAEGESISLIVLEHSGRFDLDVHLPSGYLTVADGLDVEQLCEVGLKVLQAALYNTADPEVLKGWLRDRLKEVDFSGNRTPFPKGGT